jgi:chlorobactene glucosyltransferase
LSDLWAQQLTGPTLFVAVLLLIALSNLWALRRLGNYALPTRWPRVSALVPARNEEANIGPCLRSLLAQEYPDFEVLVLDDHSDDATGRVLADLAAEEPRLHVIRGKPLPGGWFGKPWACEQLAQAATGDLLLFTDADTRHHPHMLRDAVAALSAENADLLTALPRQEVVSWSERLLVPIILWSVFAFLPLGLAHRLRLPALSAAIGQFMLFRRPAYRRIGGHAAVRENNVEDMALARRIKAHSLRWRLVDGRQRIRSRMYHNCAEVYNGFTRNLFGAFDYKIALFVLIWLWLGLVFLAPLIALGWWIISGRPATSPLPGLAIPAIAGALLLWGVTYWRFGLPLYMAVLYPITILLAVFIAMRSMAFTLTGRVTWKGRTVVRQERG